MNKMFGLITIDNTYRNNTSWLVKMWLKMTSQVLNVQKTAKATDELHAGVKPKQKKQLVVDS